MAKRRETSTHREAFEDWYAAGRSVGNAKICEKLQVNPATIYRWMEWFNWHERADVRDAEAQRIADAEAIKERAERQKRRRQAAELLTQKGMEFFNENDIDTPSVAIQAIKAGLENERKEDGVPDWVLMILNADESELEKLARDLANSVACSEETGSGDDFLSPDAEAEGA